jgi:hypothetical protein
MTTGASSGGWFDAGIIRRKTTKRTKTKPKVGEGGLHRKRFDNRVGRWQWHCNDGGCMGDPFQRVVGTENGSVMGNRPSSMISCVKLKGEGEVLNDKRMDEAASEAIDVSHHARRAMKHLKEVTKEFLGPAAALVDGPVTFENFFDSTMSRKPMQIQVVAEELEIKRSCWMSLPTVA